MICGGGGFWGRRILWWAGCTPMCVYACLTAIDHVISTPYILSYSMEIAQPTKTVKMFLFPLHGLTGGEVGFK